MNCSNRLLPCSQTKGMRAQIPSPQVWGYSLANSNVAEKASDMRHYRLALFLRSNSASVLGIETASGGLWQRRVRNAHTKKP